MKLAVWLWRSTVSLSGLHSRYLAEPCVPGCDLFFMQGVCLSAACPFAFRYTVLEKPEQPWQLSLFEPHIPGCGSPDRRKRRTCYNLGYLARLVVQSHTGTNTKVSREGAKVLLNRYTHSTPSPSALTRICDYATRLLRGNPDDNFGKLLPYLEELKILGYGAKAIEVDSVAMDAITL